jgi:hypothetical protein
MLFLIVLRKKENLALVMILHLESQSALPQPALEFGSLLL